MRTVVLVGFLLACGGSGVIGAPQCKEAKFDVASGLCKGAKVDGKFCMGDGMTADIMKAFYEAMTKDADCKQTTDAVCALYGGTTKADYCNENAAYCKSMISGYAMGACTKDADCEAIKKPCCSAIKSEASAVCNDVKSDKVDAFVTTSKAAGGCADTDCVSNPSGATSMRGGTMLASAASALIALMVTTVY